MRTESRRKIAPARAAAGKPHDAIEMCANILALGCIRPAGHVTAVIDLTAVQIENAEYFVSSVRAYLKNKEW